MSTFLCFICHSTVNADTNEETREKYKEVVGMNLCPDSHLCFICCHMMKKLCLFKAVCLKRSLEYPVLFSEKGTLNLKRTDIEHYIFCPEECGQESQLTKLKTEDGSVTSTKSENYYDHDQNYDDSNQYAFLADDDENFDDYLPVSFLTNDKSIIDCRLRDDWFNCDAPTFINTDNQHDEEVNQMIHTQEKNDVKETSNVDHMLNVPETFNDIENNTERKEYTAVAITESFIKDINYDDNDDDEMNIINETNINDEIVDSNEIAYEIMIPSKKKGFKKVKLSVDEQKGVLEDNRRKKKYVEAEFKCYNCALGFLFNDTYQAHMMRHEESNGEHVCPICSLRFASVRSFRAHVLAHSNRLRCKKCDVILSANPRQKCAHARLCQGVQDGGDSNACHLCGKIFKGGSSLEQHLRRSHRLKSSGRTYSCNVCGKSYNNQAAVRSHMTKHLNRKFRCDQCPSLFSSPHYLNQHKKGHDTTDAAQHYCVICNVGFSSRKNLLAHKRNTLKHQQTAFDCPICSRSYANQRSLASHIETIHSATKNHACPQCDARYSSRKSLVRHIKSHGPRPPPKRAMCYLCGTSLASTSKLHRHLREVCEKSKLEEQLSSYYEQEVI